jgi:hypothetical protein
MVCADNNYRCTTDTRSGTKPAAISPPKAEVLPHNKNDSIDTLGGNIERGRNNSGSQVSPNVPPEPPNPDPLILTLIGFPLSGASLIVEGAILYSEVAILPSIALAPEIGILLELVLGATGAAILDINIAYWSYIYRVVQEPNEMQEIELLPPWGFGKNE